MIQTDTTSVVSNAAAYDKLLHQTMPGAKVKQERGNVRMLTSNLAIWQGGIEIFSAGATTHSLSCGMVSVIS